MAEKKTGGPGFLTNPKSRMMVIGVAVVLIAGVALAVNGMLKKSALEKEQGGPTNTAALPADANKKTVIDPKKVDAQQSELRKAANEDAAKRADSSGQTFIATMRPDTAPASVATTGNAIDPTMYAARNAENGFGRYAGPREPTEQEIRDAEAAQQKKVDDWKRKLTADKAKINEVWEPGSRVFYTAYVGSENNQADKKEKESQEQPGAKADPQKKGQVFARAGDIFYGSIDIGMNTDEPSAVTAYILSGPFKGGKLLGALAGQTAPYSEKAVIQFTSLNHPKFERSIPVKIFAVDRDTKRAAVADNVDRHLLTKFGLAAIVDFAQGYAEGKAQTNSTVLYGQNGSPTVVTQSELTNQQLIARGAAKTMNRVASTLAPYTNRPNTLEVYSQTEIGLLVAADIVYVEGVNADNSGPVQGVGAANGARRALPQPAMANTYAPALPVQQGQQGVYGQQPVYAPQPAYGQQPVYAPQPAYGGQPALYGQVPVYGQR